MRALPVKREQYGFVSLAQQSETGEQPRARVVFTVDGVEVRGESVGNGLVRCIFEGHRVARQKWCRDGALFCERHQVAPQKAKAK